MSGGRLMHNGETWWLYWRHTWIQFSTRFFSDSSLYMNCDNWLRQPWLSFSWQHLPRRLCIPTTRSSDIWARRPASRHLRDRIRDQVFQVQLQATFQWPGIELLRTIIEISDWPTSSNGTATIIRQIFAQQPNTYIALGRRLGRRRWRWRLFSSAYLAMAHPWFPIRHHIFLPFNICVSLTLFVGGFSSLFKASTYIHTSGGAASC